jgi:hypothetical protein
MLRAFAVNRTLMFDAEGTRLSRAYLMAADFDLQPAIAASTASRTWLVQPIARQNGTQDEFSDAVYPVRGTSRNNFCADCEMDHIWAMIPGAFCSSPDGASQFQCPGLARPLALYYANGLVFLPGFHPKSPRLPAPPDRLKKYSVLG